MTALTLDLVLTMVSSAAMGHAGGLTLPCTGFQMLQMPKITHTSHKQLLGSRKRPSRAALAMAGTDRAIGLLHGHPVYFDSADGYQVDVDGRRRPVPSWLHIRRVGDVQVEGAAGLPQISASTQVVYPASDEAVGLFQGRPAHVDEKGGFLVSVDGEWRPVRKDDWPDVIRFTDVDVTTLEERLDCTIGRLQDDRTFIRLGRFLYQVVRRGTGVCPATGDTVRYRRTLFDYGFPPDRGSKKLRDYEATLEYGKASLYGFEHDMLWSFEHDMLWSMRVGEVRRVIRPMSGSNKTYWELELIEIIEQK
mmetsp:Transcript_7184/g.17470  ORF Transcript_7184/g.17470 Transcript_7184/m.17470 type:complete len:306 (+) Transcript_7184:1706-2623(+)